MSKNELATVYAGNTLPDLAPSMDMFNEVIKNSTFLSRIQLYTKGKAIDKGLIKPGQFGVPTSEESITDLGNEIDVIPFAWRPKALDTSDPSNTVVNYDPTSAEYKRIASESEVEGNTGYMYGVTFLVFERATGLFYELFFGTKSARREAGNFVSFCAISPTQAEALTTKTGKEVKPRGPLACSLSSKYVHPNTFGWYVPVCSTCSTPFNNLPTIDAVTEEITKFYAQKASDVEKVETTTKRRAR
jgi:hypothetical protein